MHNGYSTEKLGSVQVFYYLQSYMMKLFMDNIFYFKFS